MNPKERSKDHLLTAEEVAAWLQIQPRQVAKLKGLPVIDLGPKTKRYDPEDIRAYLATQRRLAVAA